MAFVRPALALDARRFGRRNAVRSKLPALPASSLPASSLQDDLRLFAVTFAAGFLFVSVVLA